ncbi:hypothetical protein HQ535_04130 [bacterium]|nr:hypothetical protein [bacterium]
MTLIATAPVSIRQAPSPEAAGGFDKAYQRLVDARLEYEALRSHDATTGALVTARAALHRARADIAVYRRTLGAL